MRFQFTATTPAIDHEIEARVARQISAVLPPDTQILQVEIGTWVEHGTEWRATVEVTYSDGADPFKTAERIRKLLITTKEN